MHSLFPTFSSRVIRIPLKDIDTDIIIPASFLKTTTKEGLGKHVFQNLRQNADFPLDHPEFFNARIVVAGANFGCGSSREHAPWAIKDAGIDVVISSRFADIFRGNAEKNGVLPLVLPEDVVQKLLHPEDALEELTINLEDQFVETTKGERYAFKIPNFTKKRFLEGLSDLGFLLEHLSKVRVFEAERKKKNFYVEF
jgi:3-isopropylmalate/(R)-2-methylmalate dehydratase small subunit